MIDLNSEINRIKMKSNLKLITHLTVLLSIVALPFSSLNAAPRPHTPTDKSSHTELAKAAQNPVASMISIPFQGDFNFGTGAGSDAQYIGLIEPVIPQKLSEDWNWIHRGIIPVPMYQPGLNSAWGMGDIQYEGFFTPAKPGKLIWGVGPYINFPTGTDDVLTSGKWSAGPALLAMSMPGHWVVGGLVTQLWSFAGEDDRSDVNTTAFQLICNYNIPNADGLYLTAGPILTWNWEASSGNRATIPVGGGIGKVFHIGKQHVNAKVQAFGYADVPEGGPDWSVQLQFTLLFPKAHPTVSKGK
jgi:hypothetical protein